MIILICHKLYPFILIRLIHIVYGQSQTGSNQVHRWGYAPSLAFLMEGIKHHYANIANEIQTPIELKAKELKPPVVIIPIQGLDRVAEKAIQFSMLLSDDITAVLIDTGNDDMERIKEL